MVPVLRSNWKEGNFFWINFENSILINKNLTCSLQSSLATWDRNRSVKIEIWCSWYCRNKKSTSFVLFADLQRLSPSVWLSLYRTGTLWYWSSFSWTWWKNLSAVSTAMKQTEQFKNEEDASSNFKLTSEYPDRRVWKLRHKSSQTYQDST